MNLRDGQFFINLGPISLGPWIPAMNSIGGVRRGPKSETRTGQVFLSSKISLKIISLNRPITEMF